MSSTKCYFLELPIELRLHIYEYALDDTSSVTIATGRIEGADNVSVFLPRRGIPNIPGIPNDQFPIVRSKYDAALLSLDNPPTVPRPSLPQYNGRRRKRTQQPIPASLEYPGALALLLLNHQIKHEMEAHILRRTTRKGKNVRKDRTSQKSNCRIQGGVAIYATYPYGVLVLKHMYPALLKQAKSVHISGYYVSQEESPYTISRGYAFSSRTPNASFDSGYGSTASSPTSSFEGTSSDSSTQRRTRPVSENRRILRSSRASAAAAHHHTRARSAENEIFPQHSVSTVEAANQALRELVRQILSPEPALLLEKFQMRVLYPTEAGYSHVWSDDYSPIAEGIKNICGGNIELQAYRGRGGSGVNMVAKPMPESRMVSSIWRSLDDDAVNAFVIDSEWADAKD
jgi:hypothetical protein